MVEKYVHLTCGIFFCRMLGESREASVSKPLHIYLFIYLEHYWQ